MRCDGCRKNIKEGEERGFHGQTLCEDCYMDALSPAKAYDPWVVHSAKSFSKKDGSIVEVTVTQSKILQILKETDGVEPEIISERLQLDPSDIER